MSGPTTAYLVAIAAMLFAGISALSLIYSVKHLDPPEAPAQKEDVRENVAA